MNSNQKRLTFLALSVGELGRSLHFYRDLIGVALQSEDHDSDLEDRWYGGSHAAYSWTDGAFIHFALYPHQLPHRPVTRGAQVGFHVSNFEFVHEALVGAGVEVLEAQRNEPWGKTARYLDPDGNIASITAMRV